MARGEQEQLVQARVARRTPRHASAHSAERRSRRGPVRWWTDERIERELRALIERLGLDRFPTHEELSQVPGLVSAVNMYGGSREWAAKLGLRLSELGPRRSWSEQELERELRALVARLGLDRFPSMGELYQASGESLVAAIHTHGGPNRWAARLGLRIGPRHWGRNRWSIERIESELRRFIAERGLERFPSYRTLAEAGLEELAEAVSRRGGFGFWAERCGLAPENGARHENWSMQRIERELRAYIERRGLNRMPSARELRSDGLGPLASAIDSYGGFVAWAERLGYEANPGRRRDTWSEGRVERELRALLEEHGYEGKRLPPRSWFAERGRGDLHRAINRYGGVKRFAPALGFECRTQSSREELERRLREAHEGRNEMLTTKELEELGLSGFVSRTGGIQRWAERLGMEAKHRRRYSPEEIEAELRKFIGDREYFPTQREFREAGKLGLHSSLRRHGGITHWRQKMGLPQAPSGQPKGGKQRPRRKWTKEELIAELRPYIERHGCFPSQRILREDGRTDLTSAIHKFGGARKLAAELGVELAPSKPQKNLPERAGAAEASHGEQPQAA